MKNHYAGQTKTALDALTQRKQAIANSREYSEYGKQLQARQLDSEISTFRTKALDRLRHDWDRLKAEHKNLSRRKAEAEQKSGDRWDYARLSYLAENVKSKVNKFRNLAELRSAYEQARESGDPHVKRAWAEALPGILQTRYQGEPGAGSLATKAEEDFYTVMDTPELAAVREEEGELTNAAEELQAVTVAAGEFYRNTKPLTSGIDLDAIRAADAPEREFLRLSEGVTIARRMSGTTLQIEETSQ
jgi:hypothetical protein